MGRSPARQPGPRNCTRGPGGLARPGQRRVTPVAAAVELLAGGPAEPRRGP